MFATYARFPWKAPTAYRILVGEPEGQKTLGRPKRRSRIILKGILEK
jgi:hypothetical protein